MFRANATPALILTLMACATPGQSKDAPAAASCLPSSFAADDVTIRAAAVIVVGTDSRVCRVRGAVRTTGDDLVAGSANFELDLPAQWNGKFVFNGGGGFNGVVQGPYVSQLIGGYATLTTDSGHTGDPETDASWALTARGRRNEAALADYMYRAIPQANLKVRPLVARYYGKKLRRAYFVGCSTGGREALLQAQRRAEDFDGFVAGDPSSQAAFTMHYLVRARAFLLGAIPYSTLPSVGAAIAAKCDAADGVKDGLIQNPAGCNFDAHSLVEQGLLTKAQAQAVATYISEVRDSQGEFVEPGFAVSGIEDPTNLSMYQTDPSPGFDPAHPDPFPWVKKKTPPEFLWQQGVLQSFVYLDPGLNVLGPKIFDSKGVLTHESVVADAKVWAPGIALASKMGEFFKRDRKMIIYHGLSDADTPPFETQRFYTQLIRERGSLEATQSHIRFFEAPNMNHCGRGSGPNDFDALASLDAWVETGNAPQSIIAKKFVNDDRNGRVQRTMPLCAFPGIAHYDGKGEVNSAHSWSCPAGDRTLFYPSEIGKRAGLAEIR